MARRLDSDNPGLWFLAVVYPEEVARDATIPAVLIAFYAIWFWRRRRR
jgi:hypothetical protein